MVSSQVCVGTYWGLGGVWSGTWHPICRPFRPINPAASISTHTNSPYSPLPSNLHSCTSPNVPCTSDAHDARPTNPGVILQPRSAIMQPPFPAAGLIGTPSALPQL